MANPYNTYFMLSLNILTLQINKLLKKKMSKFWKNWISLQADFFGRNSIHVDKKKPCDTWILDLVFGNIYYINVTQSFYDSTMCWIQILKSRFWSRFEEIQDWKPESKQMIDPESRELQKWQCIDSRNHWKLPSLGTLVFMFYAHDLPIFGLMMP